MKDIENIILSMRDAGIEPEHIVRAVLSFAQKNTKQEEQKKLDRREKTKTRVRNYRERQVSGNAGNALQALHGVTSVTESVSEVIKEESREGSGNAGNACNALHGVTPLPPLSPFPSSPSFPPHLPNNPIIPYPNLPLPPNTAISEFFDEQEFLIFWEKYPAHLRAKGSRRDAKRTFKVARKKAAFEIIMAGVKAYAEYLPSVDQQSSQDAHRWLTHERWADDWTIPARSEEPAKGSATADKRTDEEKLIGHIGFLAWERKRKMFMTDEHLKQLEDYEAKNGPVTWDNLTQWRESQAGDKKQLAANK